jgi:F-type H+-transporting ATPase subunit delta
MASALASRYARALADVVLRPGSKVDPQAAAAQLHGFVEMLTVSKELRDALLSPAVAPARKRAVVRRLSRDLELAGVAENFLCVIVDHRRNGLLAEIGQAFEALMDKRAGVARAGVESARELSAAERAELTAGLERTTGKKMRCVFSTDAALVGGVTARIGSRVYDGSVRGQLRSLKRCLVGQA